MHVKWSTLGKLAWESLQEPDPKSITERYVKPAMRAYADAGDAAELALFILPEPQQKR
jgi:hypothetical protein